MFGLAWVLAGVFAGAAPAVAQVPAPAWTDADERGWSQAVAQWDAWQQGCGAAACGSKPALQRCARRAAAMAQPFSSLSPAARTRLRLEHWLPWSAALYSDPAAPPDPNACTVDLGGWRLAGELEQGAAPRALVHRALWVLQALGAADGPLAARCGGAAAVARGQKKLLQLVHATGLAPVCAGLPADGPACAAAWLQWYGARAEFAAPAFDAEVTQLRWSKALPLALQAVEGEFDDALAARRLLADHPALLDHPEVRRAAQQQLGRQACGDAGNRRHALLQLVGVPRVLAAAGRDWRWAQVPIPPPASWPLPLPEAPTPVVTAPALPKALAKPLARARREFAADKRRYAGCAYEHQGFEGGMHCEQGGGVDLEPTLAAHLLDAEVFAVGGALPLGTCSDGADFRWTLAELFLHNQVRDDTRPLLLQLLAARAAALLAQAEPLPADRATALIGNFLAVAQVPVCDGNAAGERPQALRRCLATWLRWAVVHQHDDEAQRHAHAAQVAHALASSRDPADWALLVVTGACMMGPERPPAWFWAARNLLLDPAAPQDWAKLSQADDLQDYRRILYPPAWLGLSAPDLLAAPAPQVQP